MLIVWRLRDRVRTANIYAKCVFIGLFGANSAELAAFGFVDDPRSGLFVLSCYYIFILLAICGLLCLTLNVSGNCTKIVRGAIGTIFAITIAAIIIPGAAFSGVKSIDYSITRVPGPFYFVVQFGLLIPLILSLGAMLITSKKGATYAIKRQSKILLIAFTPFISACILVISLMAFKVPVNAAVIVSVAVIATLLILILSHRTEDQFNLMCYVPNSHERKLSKTARSFMANPSLGIIEARSFIECEMIKEALRLAGNNKKQASEILGISRQTLQRKITRYGI